MRKLRWYLRQIVPTKFATAYRTDVERDGVGTPVFVRWWMWGGRCFAVNQSAV